jgi:hypothetical protein
MMPRIAFLFKLYNSSFPGISTALVAIAMAPFCVKFPPMKPDDA